MKKTINLHTGIGVPVTAIRRNADMGIYPYRRSGDCYPKERRYGYLPIYNRI